MSKTRFLPPELAERGLREVHQWPLVLDADKRPRGRLPAAEAWAEFPRVELQPPNCYSALLFDVDEPRQKGWPGGKPRILPTWLVLADSGRMHVGYALQSPVHNNPESMTGPLAKLADVADRLTHQLGGDAGYGGRITRNPVNPGPGATAHYFSFAPYALDWLDGKLPKTRTRRGERLSGVGRNVDTFRLMVKEAHQPRWARLIHATGWAGEWLEHVRARNVGLWGAQALPDGECRSIAKSCARYAMRQYDTTGAYLSRIQQARNGKRWHGKYDFDFDARDASLVSLSELGGLHHTRDRAHCRPVTVQRSPTAERRTTVLMHPKTVSTSFGESPELVFPYWDYLAGGASYLRCRRAA